MLRRCLAAAIASTSLVGTCHAWTSDACPDLKYVPGFLCAPFFPPIHEDAIRKALAKLVGQELSKAELDTLAQQQGIVDRAQAARDSYMHAMTGYEASERETYIRCTEDWIRNHIAEAQKQSNRQEALKLVGTAMHALEDATSPAHRGFQVWADDERPMDKVNHWEMENKYPDDAETTKRLEGVVALVWEAYKGRYAFPQQLFKRPGGELSDDVFRTVEKK